MSKKFIFVVLIAFIIVAVLPVSARDVSMGDTIYIGEQHLNLTHALNQANGFSGADLDKAPVYTRIGWWALRALIENSAPTKTIDLTGRYMDFSVETADFFGNEGTWFALAPNNNIVSLRPVFTVTFPASSIPESSFTANPVSGPAALTVKFTDTSSKNPTSWRWNFGDGTTSDLQNPFPHTYTISGVYAVTMNAYMGSTSGNTATTTITVLSPLSPTTVTTSQAITPNPTTTNTIVPSATVTTTSTTVPPSTRTTAITTRQTIISTTTPTTSRTTITTVTPKPTATVNYSATIAAMQSQIADQSTKITEQGNILDSIVNFLRNVFGWK